MKFVLLRSHLRTRIQIRVVVVLAVIVVGLASIVIFTRLGLNRTVIVVSSITIDYS
jgi:hypothetical protein